MSLAELESHLLMPDNLNLKLESESEHRTVTEHMLVTAVVHPTNGKLPARKVFNA